MTDQSPQADESELGAGVAYEGRRLLGLALFGVAILGLAYFGPWSVNFKDIGALRQLFRDDDFYAEISFVVFCAGAVVIGAPRLAFYLVAGTVFGFFKGLVLAQSGSLIGAYLIFAPMRFAGKESVVQRLEKFPWVHRRLKGHFDTMKVLLFRQLPLQSSLLSAALALTDVSHKGFALGTFLGFLPQGIVAAMIGAGIGDERYLPFIAAIAAISAAAVILAKLGRKHLRRTK